MEMRLKLLIAVGVVLIGAGAGALWLRRPSAPSVPQTAPTAIIPPQPVPHPVPSPVPDAARVTGPGLAACRHPEPAPPLPDGATAAAAEMQQGRATIQAFVERLEAYQACRNAQIDEAGADVSAAQKQRWLEQGNAAVDEANALAEGFSQQLKAYKLRIGEH